MKNYEITKNVVHFMYESVYYYKFIIKLILKL